MKSVIALAIFISAPAMAANQCLQPLESLVRSAESTAASYGKDCLKAVQNGATTVGDAARTKCEAKIGNSEKNNLAAVLRKNYDQAVRICSSDCEGESQTLCNKALRDLLVLGTTGAKKTLTKIKN